MSTGDQRNGLKEAINTLKKQVDDLYHKVGLHQDAHDSLDRIGCVYGKMKMERYEAEAKTMREKAKETHDVVNKLDRKLTFWGGVIAAILSIPTALTSWWVAMRIWEMMGNG